MSHVDEGTSNEIERRYIVRFEDVPQASRSVCVVQAYLSEGNPQVRVRSVDTREFWLTVKRLPNPGSLLERLETEVKISALQFDLLLSAATGASIRKTRLYVPIGSGVEAEVDVFEDQLSGLVIAEVEFASIADSRAFSAPEWFGREVTQDIRYLNSTLARLGLPTVP